MAVKRNALSGALVPIAGPDGGVAWQSWTYGELTQHLTNDLFLDDFTPPSSVSWTPAWTPPTLINAWVNVGAPFETAGYLKDPLRFVHLRGYVQSGTNGTIAFQLPPGYRPGAVANYPAWESGGGAGNWAGVRIDVSGNVSIFMSNPVQVSFSGITFLAEL